MCNPILPYFVGTLARNADFVEKKCNRLQVTLRKKYFTQASKKILQKKMCNRLHISEQKTLNTTWKPTKKPF